MGPSPTWLYLLIVASLALGNTALYAWLKQHGLLFGRRILTPYFLGAMAVLAGWSLDEVTHYSRAWPGEVAFVLVIFGFVLLLTAIFRIFPVSWRTRHDPPITDPVAYFESQRNLIAFGGIGMSVTMPRVALRQEMGLAMGLVALFVAIMVPLIVWYAKPKR